MTSLQKLCQQWASISKSSKFGSQHVVSSLLIGTSPRPNPALDKHILFCQHRESLCSDARYTVDSIQRAPSELSKNVRGQFTYPANVSPTVIPKFDRFVEDSIDKVQKRNDMWDKIFSETSYFFHNGLRHVYPYDYTHHVFVKGIWVNRTIEEAFKRTFYAVHDENWVERDIANGCIRVNGTVPRKDYVLKSADKIEHSIHRHELPVTDFKAEVLYYDSNIIAINKPPSVPIHPTGRYQHNTLLYILAREYNMRDAHIIHRLDKGTSGVLLFGRNKSTASFFSQENSKRKTSKTYIARVVGKFPDTITCEEALKPIDYKTRIMSVCKTGKPSKTDFELLGYNQKTNRSVVLCRPYTGRTHQIRVHLQYLGFPIDNDPLYNSPIFGKGQGKGGIFHRSTRDIIKDYERARSRWNTLEHATSADTVCEPWLTWSKEPSFDQSKISVDKECEVCPLHLLIAKDDFGFHLHALEFKGDGWSFSSPLPEWANLDWEESPKVHATN